MPFESFDHTADVGVDVWAPTLTELFAEAARALTTVLCDLDTLRATEARRTEVTAPDLERLLVEWLEELLTWFDVDQWLACSARVSVTGGPGAWRLSAVVDGERFDADRHRLNVLVKAVTYHALSVTKSEDGWRARIVFDI